MHKYQAWQRYKNLGIPDKELVNAEDQPTFLFESSTGIHFHNYAPRRIQDIADPMNIYVAYTNLGSLTILKLDIGFIG